jgi:hypothetical protein
VFRAWHQVTHSGQENKSHRADLENPLTDGPVDASAWTSASDVVRVAVGVPVDRTFDYATGGLGPLPRGTIVVVPFGPRQLNGIILGPGDGSIARESLKAVIRCAPVPPMTEAFVQFLERVTAWTMAPVGSVAKMALSQPKALQPPPQQKLYYRPSQLAEEERLTTARQRVADVLVVAGAMNAADLRREAGVSSAVITGQGSLQAISPRRARSIIWSIIRTKIRTPGRGRYCQTNNRWRRQPLPIRWVAVLRLFCWMV